MFYLQKQLACLLWFQDRFFKNLIFIKSHHPYNIDGKLYKVLVKILMIIIIIILQVALVERDKEVIELYLKHEDLRDWKGAKKFGVCSVFLKPMEA